MTPSVVNIVAMLQFALYVVRVFAFMDMAV